MTAAADCSVEASNTAQGAAATTRQLTLTTGASVSTFVQNAIFTTDDAIAGCTASAGHTTAVRNDFGTELACSFYMTAIQTGGSIVTSAGLTAEQWGMAAVAIREGSATTAIGDTLELDLDDRPGGRRPPRARLGDARHGRRHSSRPSGT